jgi:site-specific recombinase XerD
MIEENAVQVGSVIEVGTPKNHKKRTVPFPRFLGEYLGRQCEGKGRDGLVFPGESGRHLRLARVHEDNMSWFGSAVKRTGIPRITPHDLRHSAASFAVSAGANVKVVQKMLGHSSAAMTLDTYADLFDGDLDSFGQSERPYNPCKQREVGPFSSAVTVGFEPTLALTPNNISSVAPSAARTRHHPE